MGAEIPKLETLRQKVFGSHNEKAFAEIALEVFRYQFLTNEVGSPGTELEFAL